MSNVKVYKRGGMWKVSSVGLECWEFATWGEAFGIAFDMAVEARRIMTIEYEYGFIADGGPLRTAAFGIVPFESAEMAYHTGSKWFLETLVIVRRRRGSDDEWVEVEE